MTARRQTDPDALREQVRGRYAAAATKVTSGDCGCGQPADCGCGESCCGAAATAQEPGLGWWHRRAVVGQAGRAVGQGVRAGHDRGDAGLARANAAEAGATNVDFLKGQIEAIPLPAGTVDVVISNCVVNLSTDKPAVFAETFRVLKPGGRIGITDVVAEDQLSPAERAERGAWVGCIAGALSSSEYETGLAAAGFEQVSVACTHQVGEGLHSAIIKATKPTDAESSTSVATPASRTALPMASDSGCC